MGHRNIGDDDRLDRALQDQLGEEGMEDLQEESDFVAYSLDEMDPYAI